VLTIVEDYLDLYPGYGGLEADVPTRTLRLYWRQAEPPPAQIMDILAAPGRPVTVDLLDSPYGRLELNEARDLLVDNADSLDAQLCGFLHTFVVPQDASTVLVRIEPDNQFADPAAYITTAQSFLTALAGYPVRVELAPAFESTIGGREAERSPWYAGGAIKEKGKDRHCSSGFGVVKNPNSWLLSAAHCFENGVTVETDPGAQEIGKVSDKREKLDSERISANRVAGKTYVKGVDSNESLTITEPGWNVAGLFVCTSGAATGMNCHLKITAIDAKVRAVLRPLKVLAEFQVLADATKPRGRNLPGVAVGGGDSGGPVILISNDPTVNSMAAGIATAGEAANNVFWNHRVKCNDSAKTRRCYSRVAYTAIRPILKEYGVTLAP
jgi:Trypsin